ncbi:hypothetical protein DPMN_024612 [Dreissena polymorpha]|uniref:Uncharacterized protein n=1 Tax=Dreissena polymorpha TaxID=45954 RepID=A0A9D4LQ37_DREPO|nr:hypothetical protein DPMN_024612 [Dreissena polymorpha]
MTSPLHLGEDSKTSSVEDVRLEGDGLSWISRATRRSSPQERKSSADYSRLGRDAHAPAADRAALLLRSFYEFTPIHACNDPATPVLSMFKISLSRA